MATTFVGATVLPGAYADTSTDVGTANELDGYLSHNHAAIKPALAIQKTYFQLADMGGGATARMKALNNAGCKLIISFKPSTTISTTNDNNFLTTLRACISAGFSFKCVLYQEPLNDSKFPTATSYINYFRHYATLARSNVTSPPPMCYNPNLGAPQQAVLDYWPGNSYVDEIGADFYCQSYVGSNHTLTNCQTLADGAGIPLSIWEFGSAGDSKTASTPSEYTTYTNYIISLFQARLSAGKPNGDIVAYCSAHPVTNPDGTTNPGVANVITSGTDYKVPGFQAIYDALNGTGGGTSGVVTLATIANQSNAPGDTVNVALSATTTTSGANASGWKWSAGNLPKTVVIGAGTTSTNALTGTITPGTPPQTLTCTATATDSAGAKDTNTFTWTITAPPVPTITSPGNQTSAIGQPVTPLQVQVAGGTPPYTYSASGLPSGLAINAGTGQISGTPGGAPASVTVTLNATDSASVAAAPVTFTWTTVYNTITITAPGNQSGPAGTPAANVQLRGSSSGGEALSWTAAGLPPGLSCSAGGLISGTPSTPGTYTVTATAADGTGATGQATFSWTVLGSGLVLHADGSITGAPAKSGVFPITVQVADAAGQTATTGLSLTIGASVTVTTTSLPDATVGLAYQAQLSAAGATGPYTFTATGLPPGLSCTAAGLINGTPTTAGTYTTTITATSAGGTASQPAALPLTVAGQGALAIATTSVPPATTGLGYQAQLTAIGGTPPYTWQLSAGALPAGLALDPATGLITGTPVLAGTYGFTVTVTDSAGAHVAMRIGVQR